MDRPRDALAEGTELAGYVIGQVLGRGGFGITYAATDALHPDIKVAIKEFLPGGLGVRESGSATVHPASPADAEDFAKALARFQEEARTLLALRHPNIVDAQRFIKANGTAYVVMKYEEGTSLGARLGANGTLPEAELRKLLPPLLDGIEAVHARHFLHRDIKPDNIYLRSADGSPVLLDFGAARQAMADDRKTSLTEIVTPGYAPYEQYDRHSQQGTYTDIYALGATLYRCVTGQRPPDATTRINALARKQPDPMRPARAAAKGAYTPEMLDAIDKALAVFENERPQSIGDLRGMLGLEAAPADGTLNLAHASPLSRSTVREAASPRPIFPRRWPLRVAAAGLATAIVLAGSYYAWSEYRAGQERAAAVAKAESEAAQRRAAEERRRAEAEARRKAEEEAREDEARRKAEQERIRAEEVRRKAEEEARRRQDEERKRVEEQRRRDDEEKRRREAEVRREDWTICERESVYGANRSHAACTRLIDAGLSGNELASALAYRADAANALDRHQDALNDADRALALDPGNWIGWKARGDGHFRLREYADALAAYNRALAIHPHVLLYFSRGRLYEAMGNRSAAIRDFRDASSRGYWRADEQLRRLGVTP